jgi:hypothetical protein
VQDATGRYRFVGWIVRGGPIAPTPVPLGPRSNDVAARGIAALARGDCDTFFYYFWSYSGEGGTADKVCGSGG